MFIKDVTLSDYHVHLQLNLRNSIAMFLQLSIELSVKNSVMLKLFAKLSVLYTYTKNGNHPNKWRFLQHFSCPNIEYT